MKKRKRIHVDFASIPYYYTSNFPCTIFMLVLFISGCFISWHFFYKPLEDYQFEEFEQIALEVYSHAIYEEPDDLHIEVTLNTITITSSNPFYFGKVIAQLQKDDDLVITRDPQKTLALCQHLFFGMIFMLLYAVLVDIFFAFWNHLFSNCSGNSKKVQEKSSKK